jgi:hypothetical protein
MSRVGRIQKLVEGRWRIWRSLILMEMRRIDQPESLQRVDIKVVIFRARGAIFGCLSQLSTSGHNTLPPPIEDIDVLWSMNHEWIPI